QKKLGLAPPFCARFAAQSERSRRGPLATMVEVRDNNPNGDAKVAVVKKYANRRLYNTATSSYVTLDDLSKMVRRGEHFVVYDAKSGEDLTRSILTQII